MFFRKVFSRVKTMEADEAQDWMARQAPGSFTLLDVRNPKEFAGGFIPGAVLIPLSQLEQRWGEIDPKKPVVTY